MLKYTKSAEGRYCVRNWNGSRWVKVARISWNNGHWKVMEIVGKRLSLLYFGNSKIEAFGALARVRS